MRGPPKKPTALKIVQGNPGKRKLPENEPMPDKLDNYIPPEGMSERAAAHWPQAAKKLADANVMTVLDTDALRMYCEYFAQWVDAMEYLRDHDLVSVTEKGYPVVSPMVGIANKAAGMMAKMMVQFGMTPAARANVKTAGGKEESDGFDEL